MYDYCYKLLDTEDDVLKIKEMLDKEKVKYHKKICQKDLKKEKSLLIDYAESFTGKDEEQIHDIEKSEEKCQLILKEVEAELIEDEIEVLEEEAKLDTESKTGNNQSVEGNETEPKPGNKPKKDNNQSVEGNEREKNEKKKAGK